METFERPDGHLAGFLKDSFQAIAAREAALSTLQTLQTKVAPIEKFLGHFGFQFVLDANSVESNLSMRVSSNVLLSGDDNPFNVTSYYEPSLQKRGFLISGTNRNGPHDINASVIKSGRPSTTQYLFSLSENGQSIREGSLSEAIMRDLALALGRISPNFFMRAKTAWKKTFPLGADLDHPDTHRAPGYSQKIKQIAALSGTNVRLNK